MKISHLLIIIALTCLTFSNSLTNGFIGDDEILITNNSFYTKLSNIPKLFSKQYSTDSYELLKRNDIESSGSVAYRPVLSMTYFLDHWIWGKNPFGFHLHNLILHLLNVLLVYVIAIYLIKKDAIALFAALLFSLHPVRVEAVCSVGYRADLLSCLFVLIAFVLFLKYRSKGTPNNLYLIGSLGAFFLSVFTKETAIMFLPMIMAYDFIFKESHQKDRGTLVKTYIGYIAIAAFYLFLYVYVFPNTSLVKAGLIGGTLKTHVISSLWIFVQYIKFMLFPFTVFPIIPLAAPDILPFMHVRALFSLFVIYGYGWLVVHYWRTNRMLMLLLSWFIIFLLPTLNIIPFANPIAHRFLYLPSVGLFIVMAFWVEAFCQKVKTMKNLGSMERIIKVSILAACIFVTFPQNSLWKSNMRMAHSWMRDYPNHEKGYSLYAIELFKLGMFQEAREPLLKCVKLKSMDPRIYYALGMAYMDQPNVAILSFQRAIDLYPEFISPYLGMGRLHVMQESYDKAVSYLEKSIAINPTYSGVGYLIQSYLSLDRQEEAQNLLNKAKNYSFDESHMSSLHKLFESRNKNLLPVDIGI